MNAFTLKIIALASMLIDHIGAIMPEVFGLARGANVFRLLGRAAFPIFVYLIAEGFRYTKSPVKFLARLGLFALISEVPFDLAFNEQIHFFAQTNIFYTLFLGGVAIFAYQKLRENHPVAATLPTIGMMLIAQLLTADYGAEGVLFIFLMYAITPIVWRLVVMAVMCVLQHFWIFEYTWRGYDIPLIHWLMFPATLVPVALFAFYNGKRGPGYKWFFYIAYPAHILFLFFIA